MTTHHQHRFFLYKGSSQNINANEVLIYDVVREFTGINKEFDKKA